MPVKNVFLKEKKEGPSFQTESTIDVFTEVIYFPFFCLKTSAVVFFCRGGLNSPLSCTDCEKCTYEKNSSSRLHFFLPFCMKSYYLCDKSISNSTEYLVIFENEIKQSQRENKC